MWVQTPALSAPSGGLGLMTVLLCCFVLPDRVDFTGSSSLQLMQTDFPLRLWVVNERDKEEGKETRSPRRRCTLARDS